MINSHLKCSVLKKINDIIYIRFFCEFMFIKYLISQMRKLLCTRLHRRHRFNVRSVDF